jgi:AcrR family transcriptional regulator
VVTGLDDLLWVATDRAAHRTPALTRERIVRAAVALADAEGLAALSMKRLATEVGAATMSLYRHVPGKPQLVSMMLDEAIGEPPSFADGAWRDALAGWARANREVFVRHPWTLPLVTESRMMGPHELAWAERALRVIASTGVPIGRCADVLMLVNGYVRGAVAGEIPARLPSPDLLRRSGRAEQYPTLTAVLAAGDAARSDPPDPPDPQPQRSPEHRETGGAFDFGLRRVLDGIERYIAELPGVAAV